MLWESGTFRAEYQVNLKNQTCYVCADIQYCMADYDTYLSLLVLLHVESF